PFAMPALRRVNQQGYYTVKRYKDPNRLAQIRQPISRRKKFGEREDEDRKVEQERRIGQVGNHLPGEPRAIRVIIGEQSEAGFEASTLFAGLEQGHIKCGQPLMNALQRFVKSISMAKLAKQLLNRLAVGGGRR